MNILGVGTLRKGQLRLVRLFLTYTLELLFFLLIEGIPCDLRLVLKGKDPTLVLNSFSEILLCTSSGFSSTKTNGTHKRHIFIHLMGWQTKVGYVIFIIAKRDVRSLEELPLV